MRPRPFLAALAANIHFFVHKSLMVICEMAVPPMSQPSTSLFRFISGIDLAFVVGRILSSIGMYNNERKWV